MRAAAAPGLERQTEVRTMAHHALDAWLDTLEAEAGQTPTLLAISERFMATRLDLLGACLEAVITQRDAADLAQTEAVCPCGRLLRRRRVDAKAISTRHGQVTLRRPYFYCEACATGFPPWTRSCRSPGRTTRTISRSDPRAWGRSCPSG